MTKEKEIEKDIVFTEEGRKIFNNATEELSLKPEYENSIQIFIDDKLLVSISFTEPVKIGQCIYSVGSKRETEYYIKMLRAGTYPIFIQDSNR